MSSRIYLDSNIWINYLWVEKVSFPEEFHKENNIKKVCYDIITNLDTTKYKIISSLFNDSEISLYFRDYLRFVKGLGLGFDYTNSHKQKQGFTLDKKEKDEINSCLEHIANKDSVEVIEFGLDEKSMTFFRLAICDYYLDYMDALHLIGALINQCKYIITADKDFCSKGNTLLKEQNLSEDIKIVYYKNAKSLLGVKK